MKLAKYLADYLQTEFARISNIHCRNLQQFIQQGIEAFESTERVRIRIIDEQRQELNTLISLAKEFVEWTKGKSFCNSGQHICDKLSSYFEEILK